MKIRLSAGKCVGHARCAAVAPEIYGLDDNGYLVLAEQLVPTAKQAIAQRGARACPERAIVVEQDDPESSVEAL